MLERGTADCWAAPHGTRDFGWHWPKLTIFTLCLFFLHASAFLFLLLLFSVSRVSCCFHAAEIKLKWKRGAEREVSSTHEFWSPRFLFFLLMRFNESDNDLRQWLSILVPGTPGVPRVTHYPLCLTNRTHQLQFWGQSQRMLIIHYNNMETTFPQRLLKKKKNHCRVFSSTKHIDYIIIILNWWCDRVRFIMISINKQCNIGYVVNNILTNRIQYTNKYEMSPHHLLAMLLKGVHTFIDSSSHRRIHTYTHMCTYQTYYDSAVGDEWVSSSLRTTYTPNPPHMLLIQGRHVFPPLTRSAHSLRSGAVWAGQCPVS